MEYAAFWMFPALLLLIFLGYHVAFSLASVAFVFGLITYGDIFIWQIEENPELVD